MPFYEFSIAVGHDAADDLENIEAIVPTDDVAFKVPDGFATFNAGIIRVRHDGLDISAGFKSAIWLFPGLTRLQWQWLWERRGLVTIRTLNDEYAFANYNAVMSVPKLAALRQQRRLGPYEGGAFEDVEITFRRLQLIED